MANRSEALDINVNADRWSALSAPAAGATCGAGVSAAGATTKINLVSLSYSILNMSAAPHTTTLQVRDASIAGTVLWSMDFLVANAAAAQGTLSNIELQNGLRGNGLYMGFSTLLASVKESLSACGWFDNL